MRETRIGRRRVYTGRHVKVDFEMNRKGIARCAVGPELAHACHDIVSRIALPYAVSISPRSTQEHQHYQDSFIVQTVFTGLRAPESIGRPPMLRVASRLVNTADHAAAVEFGTEETPAHHILRKTLAHLTRLHA